MADITYYRQILDEQTKFLNLNIDKYLKILDTEFDHLSETVIGKIHLVIGQSRLFINERFKQFSGLVDDCEYKRSEKEIKIEDLAGFWDMINYQIDDLKSKFIELEQLQLNNWRDLLLNNNNNGIIKNGSNNNNNNEHHHHHNHNNHKNDCIDGVNHNHKQQIKTKSTTNVKSNFREFLKAKKQQQINNNNNSNTSSNNKNGHHHNDDDDIKIIMINNNSNNQNLNNNDNSKRNGHLNNNNGCLSTTATNENVINNDESNGITSTTTTNETKSIQLSVNH